MRQDAPPPNAPRPRAGIADIPRFSPAAEPTVKPAPILLNTNENRFGASPAVAEAIARELSRDRLHLYPPIEAQPLNRALAERHGLPSECVMSVGGCELLLPLALVAYAGPGDEVAWYEDGFRKFHGYILTSGATPIPVPRAEDPVGAMLAAVTPRTRAVLVDNPGNPTGRMLPAEEIARLHAGLPPDVLLMLDEAYIEFTDTPRLGLGYVPAAENVLVFRTMSKAYGLAGLRIGWAAGAVSLIEAVKRVLPTFPLSRLALAGALAAIEDEAHLANVVAAIRSGREATTTRLRAAGWDVPDSQGNFVLARAGAPGTDVLDAAERLAAHAVLVRMMPDFLGTPALRITIGTPQDMEHFFRAIGA